MRTSIVHVISYRLLREFSQEYPEATEPLKAWHRLAKRAGWTSIADVKLTFPHADAAGKCTIFNVMGNHFRLVVQIDYEDQVIYTKKVMTHAEYSIDNGKRWKKACGC